MNRVHELFGIDLRSLALFRVTLGLLILYDLASRLPDIGAFYTDPGVLPRVSLLNRMPGPWFSLHLMNGTASVQAALLAIQAVCAVGLLLGWRTRWMAALAWFLTASLHRRNHMVAGGGDDYFRLLLFWSMFLPMGARYSLDRASSPVRQPLPTHALSWGTAALLLQTAVGYWMAAYHKWNLPVWRQGTAIYYALNVDNYAKDFAQLLLQFPSLLEFLTHATLRFELLGPFLLFCPMFTGPIRTATVFGFLLMHLGFYMSMHLMLFPWVSAAAMLVFLPSWFWDRLVFTQAPARPIRLRSSIWANACAIVLLICVFSWNLEAAMPATYRMPEAIRSFCRFVHLDQVWRMFAPPMSRGGWFLVPGKLVDGTAVDLFRDGAPVSWEKPPQRARYKNERWRRYMFSFVFGKNKVFWPDYARYLCRSWNGGHAGAQQLESLEIVFMARRTPPPGQTAPYQKQVMLAQRCAAAPDKSLLDADTRAHLLAHASQAIRETLEGDPDHYIPPSDDPALNLPAGVFVTLTKQGRLRGCRGTTAPSRTLLDGVIYFAREAAFHDPRFPPLTKEELDAIRIKLSVLSPLEQISSAEQIVPGVHGVMVRSGSRRGLFLPSVWEKVPSKERFLSELCVHKAKLSAECWRDPQTTLHVFTTTDFEG